MLRPIIAPSICLIDETDPSGLSFRSMQATRTNATSALLRYGTGAAVAGLVFFHAWLVGRRLADPAGPDPKVLLRWGAGLAVLGALLWLRRLGLSVVRGRKALALWTVALLLHGNAPTGPVVGDAQSPAGPETLVLVLPGVLSAVTASAFLLLASLRPRP